MKIIINENERGFLLKNGKYLRTLEPGKHVLLGGGYEVERMPVDSYTLNVTSCGLDTLLADPALANLLTVAEVADETIALHYIDGRFQDALTSGRYAYWNICQNHEFRMVDISEPMADSAFPVALFAKLPSHLYKRAEVQSFQKGRLSVNGKIVRLLDAGTYFFWQNGTKVEVSMVDTRLLQMNVQGQEMLTLDKVAVCINFVCRYRIEDFIKVMILPGEVREIMNTVLIAEKRAQANAIIRREEVASTRSLLNTAKLMEENPTLLHLKEMECLEKICENVGNITVSGTGDLLGQLAGIMKGTIT